MNTETTGRPKTNRVAFKHKKFIITRLYSFGAATATSTATATDTAKPSFNNSA
jgi:hypothetical protein